MRLWVVGRGREQNYKNTCYLITVLRFRNKHVTFANLKLLAPSLFDNVQLLKQKDKNYYFEQLFLRFLTFDLLRLFFLYCTNWKFLLFLHFFDSKITGSESANVTCLISIQLSSTSMGKIGISQKSLSANLLL